jgi:cytochrome oxidase Cu insertion factor (SCO1/SenC/PrrC family)
VTVLVATGIYLVWQLVGGLPYLTGSAHGQALLVKLGFVALLMVPAAVNRFVVKPRLRAAAAALASDPVVAVGTGAAGAAAFAGPGDAEADDAGGATASGGARTFRRMVTLEATIGAAVLAVTAIMTGLPPARGGDDAQFAGFHFDPPLEPPAIALAHGDDGRFDLADERGNAVLLFFGFTNCPDYCPLTLQEWRRVRELLGDAAAARTRFVFISVDPERDTPGHAAEYARRFDPAFIGLAPDSVALAEIESGFFLRSMRREREGDRDGERDVNVDVQEDDPHAGHGMGGGEGGGGTAGGASDYARDDAPYEVIHSTRYFLIAPDGTVRVMYSHDAAAEDVARDVRVLLR